MIGDDEIRLERLPDLLGRGGITGVSRFHRLPAFHGRVVCTLAYQADGVRVEVVDALCPGGAAFRGSRLLAARAMRRFGPLATWERLRAAAFATPSCCDPRVLDGISYRHAALDWSGGTEASWVNPDLTAHPRQCELAEAYESLISATGILLEVGTRVRVRYGPLAGLSGVVEQLDRYKDRVRAVVGLAGGGATIDLSVSAIEFASDAPDQPGDPAAGLPPA